MTKKRRLFKLMMEDRTYAFRVFEEGRKITGYLSMPGRKTIGRVIKCDQEDHWDEAIGIATLKFRLDLANPSDYAIEGPTGRLFPYCTRDDKGNMITGWKKIKEFLTGKKHTTRTDRYKDTQ